MGSLVSRPKVPKYTPPVQTVYVPATTTSTQSTGSDSGNAGPSDSDLRSQSLLSRDRGRLGTIETGFRGLLGLSNNEDQRKTLLGQ